MQLSVQEYEAENENDWLFSGSSAASAPNGTTIKFDPVIASDTMAKNGTTQNINTKHICITAMKQYEGKSLEVGEWETSDISGFISEVDWKLRNFPS